MGQEMEALYQERLRRYVTAMRNGKPDRVPIRPFVAEFTARYAGYTCQEVTHDYPQGVRGDDPLLPGLRLGRRRREHGLRLDRLLTQAIGLSYYGVPGHRRAAGHRLPVPRAAGGRRLHDATTSTTQLIDDPTRFLYNVWLPRVVGRDRRGGRARDLSATTSRSSRAAWRCSSTSTPSARRSSGCAAESGTVVGDRGHPQGAVRHPGRQAARLHRADAWTCTTQPDKVLAACEALMPHLCDVALDQAPTRRRQLPIGFWMHRGCVPFVSPDQFESHYWPTVKPIIEELWRNGHQTLFYAEGNWDAHLDALRRTARRAASSTTSTAATSSRPTRRSATSSA